MARGTAAGGGGGWRSLDDPIHIPNKIRLKTDSCTDISASINREIKSMEVNHPCAALLMFAHQFTQ
ncbi:hypothetical protein AAC03nite_19860 [Alicyclobacillus acidoterrestris]|nr:hypothetical protein AAC03nite_19860 [Alicyclobacillus acidoterrestris]